MKVLCNCDFEIVIVILSMTTFDLEIPPFLYDDILIVNIIYLAPVLRKVSDFVFPENCFGRFQNKTHGRHFFRPQPPIK